jgi:D-alanyl-D-alanine carboxypeptidase (penicillin-binding protein 5/6)
MMNFKKTAFITLLLSLYGLGWAASIPTPKPPSTNSRSYILVDHHTQHVIAEKNADERNDPASITKLMTAYIVYKTLAQGSIELTDQVLVSEKAWRAVGSRMFIEVGTYVTIEQLLQGLIVQSGNDASIALAEHIAGSESAFADLMNAQAAELGLNNSHFMNATGLTHEQHYTTARDIATLSTAIIRDFPLQYQRYSVKEYTYNNITQKNRNRLLWRDPSVDGLKTGHTEAAKYCLASSALRNGMRLTSVILGASSSDARVTQSQSLLNYGFRFFETHNLYQAQQSLMTKRVWYGAQEEIQLGVAEDVVITLARGRYKDIKPHLELPSRIEAPIQEGQVLGKVIIAVTEQDSIEYDLVALQSIEEGSFMRKLSDYVMGYFE